MSTALGLAMQISANTAQLGAAVQDINKRLDQMAGSGKKAADDLSVLKNIEIAKAFIAGITAVASGLMKAAGAAKDLFDGSRQAIDEIGKLSSRTGIAVETIQQLQLVATESGSSTDALATAFGRLGAEIGKGAVEGGADKVNKKFELLGLTYEQLSQLSPEEQFYAVADAVEGIEDPAQRLAAVTEIFGTRAGQPLVNALQLGGDKIRELQGEAAELGGTLSKEAVSAVGNMNDQIGRVGFAFNNVVNQVTSALAPVVTSFAEKIQEIIKGMGVENIGKFLAEALLNFGKSFLSGLEFIVDTILVVAEQIGQVLQALGVDTRTDEQKQFDAERESLESRQEAEESLRTRRLVDGGRENFVNRTLLGSISSFEENLDNLGGALSEAERQRLADLQNQENQPGSLRQSARGIFADIQAGLDSGIALLNAQPDAPNVAGQTVAEGDTNADVVDAVNRNTEQQRRNATQPVAIIGGAGRAG